MRSWTQVARISVAALVTFTQAVVLSSCGGDPLAAPQPEVGKGTIKLTLPTPPAFDMPEPHPDGTHSVREMRLKSRKLLDTEVQVKGFVTWAYDCVRELQGQDESEAEVRKKVEADPTICQRPHFYLGDTPDTPGEKSIWVMDVPRKLRADERQRLSRAERAALPNVPDFEPGDEVIVTGTWATQSPTGSTNSEGLLVYGSMENLGRADD